MNDKACYENYPAWIVALSASVSFAIYALGALIVYRLGIVWLVLYLLYILALEIRLLRKSCVNCYYYGKVCAFGKGKLSCLFFKKGDTEQFSKTQITWKDILPDFLVSLVPIVAGIVLLVIDFNWLLLTMVVLLLWLTFTGNGFIRGSLACKYCKQRELGCPAEKLFNRKRRSATSPAK